MKASEHFARIVAMIISSAGLSFLILIGLLLFGIASDFSSFLTFFLVILGAETFIVAFAEFFGRSKSE